MPEQPAQVRRILSPRQERKELLALACAVDRTAWRQAAVASIHRTRHRFFADLLKCVEPLVYLLPGRFGRWLRWARSISQLGRLLGARFL